MTPLGRIRATSTTLFVALACLCALPVGAYGQGYVQLAEADLMANRPINLGVNKSIVIDLPRPAGDVLVSNPQIADAVLRTSTRLYLIGVKLGQASVFLFDNVGTQIASFDVYVEVDLSALNQLLAEAITDGFVRAEAMNGNIVLRGQVASPTSASRAQEITVGMLQGFDAGQQEGMQTEAIDKKVVNLLTITGEDQVALKVTIAEVQREITKQLGFNVGGSFTEGGFQVGTNVAGAAGGLSPLLNPGGGEVGIAYSNGNFSINAILRALDETSMIRKLAEPTLTAVSGETADFLAGGEFGYRVLQDGNGNTFTTEFKRFGVQLAFTPVVLSGGRISIKVRTSVSEISGTFNGIPTLDTREVETTVEQPSGGSFVIGGLLQQNSSREVSGFPGLRNLPIIGSLFSSKSFLDRETELVVVVTPYIVKPTSPQNLSRPDENMAMANDAEAYFLNRLTKVYGTDGQAPGAASTAQVGFTFD